MLIENYIFQMLSINNLKKTNQSCAFIQNKVKMPKH